MQNPAANESSLGTHPNWTPKYSKHPFERNYFLEVWQLKIGSCILGYFVAVKYSRLPITRTSR